MLWNSLNGGTVPANSAHLGGTLYQMSVDAGWPCHAMPCHAIFVAWRIKVCKTIVHLAFIMFDGAKYLELKLDCVVLL